MTKNQIINSIINSIRNHKDYAEKLRDNNLGLAMQSEDFRALELEKRALMQEIALDDFNGKSVIIKQKRFDEINKQLKLITKKMKLQPYDAIYNCPICKDSGYYNGELCVCAKSMLFNKLKALSGIDNKLSYTFEMHNNDLFLGTKQELKVKKLIPYLMDYSVTFPQVKFNNLILSGGTGTGKTFALSALGNSLINKGNFVLYLTAFDMHNAFLNYHIAPINEKSIFLENILNADLLIIDDLGTEPIFKNVTLEYLYLTISERTLNNLPICISTNLSPDQLLNRYGERIFSRLTDKRKSRLINIDGDDIRRRIIKDNIN